MTVQVIVYSTSVCVDDVLFSHNGPDDTRGCQWVPCCCRYSYIFNVFARVAMLFCFVIVYNDNILHTGAKSAVYHCLVWSWSVGWHEPSLICDDTSSGWNHIWAIQHCTVQHEPVLGLCYWKPSLAASQVSILAYIIAEWCKYEMILSVDIRRQTNCQIQCMSGSYLFVPCTLVVICQDVIPPF